MYFGIPEAPYYYYYLFWLTFHPTLKDLATAVSMPGGLLSMAWWYVFHDQALSTFPKGQLKPSQVGPYRHRTFAKPAAPKVPLLALVIAGETNDILYYLFSAVGIEAKEVILPGF